MRALLCIALLVAVLAAPALANNRPKPYKVSGKILSDNRGVGFDGKRLTWTPTDGKLNIVSNLQRPGLTWQLVGKTTAGPTPGNQSVYSVNWAFGAVVRTEINTTTGHLSVDLISDKIKAIKPCRNLKLGPLVYISYEAKWGHPRTVEIVVKPAIKILIVQPFIRSKSRTSPGAYAPWLEVFVTLTEKPKETLTGALVPPPPITG
ncbi:hypothetical protein COHA_002924 [Chlorella ohadii]|uniref:Uncharacterized protein n=1 Tax=Chlorella ohadii TaxID=2649997 RepID=A0AAD5DUN4_9CHLO|nr:hypothetical protein COHA_002924 [Chlorella ohadii]